MKNQQPPLNAAVSGQQTPEVENTPDCIDLRERFGDRLKVIREESYEAERSDFRSAEEKWLQSIPCKHGNFCPWGADLVAACTNKRGGIAWTLKRLPFVRIAQDGEDGVNAVFRVDHLDEVAKIMKPRTRRRLSEEQRRQCVERLRKYHLLHPRQGAK